MAIQAGRNTNYGGTIVTQKYSPLANITYDTRQKNEYSALLSNRLEQLANAHVFPQALMLVTDWDTQLAAVSRHPPLVVISTNHSKWIAAGVEVAIKQLAITEYEGSNDLSALTGLADKQTQSPPLYAPQRNERDRKIYIVVHMHEYHQYSAALAESGMTVVGWSFSTRATAPASLAGFGASRYAAIEFCKYLRANMAGVKWDYAWLLDDNVVGMTNFPGYAAVEAAMKAATPEPVCSAFHGGSSVEPFLKIKKWANDEVNATPTRGKPTVLPDPETPPLIIQQAALWNIKFLAEKKLNFAPLFIASGEDVSLGNYFNVDIPAKSRPSPKPPIPAKPPIPYIYYGAMTVLKEVVNYNDDSRGAKLVTKAREDYGKWFAAEEAKDKVTGRTLPPPVEIDVSDTRYLGVQKLSEFIRKWFNDTEKKERPGITASGDPQVQDKAKCQAVEQIVCGAIKNNAVDLEVVNSIFTVSGKDGQVILRRPPPPPRRT